MPRRRKKWYPTGSTNIDISGAVIMPPIMGAAMRLMTSEPVPSPHFSIPNRYSFHTRGSQADRPDARADLPRAQRAPG